MSFGEVLAKAKELLVIGGIVVLSALAHADRLPISVTFDLEATVEIDAMMEIQMDNAKLDKDVQKRGDTRGRKGCDVRR